VEQIKRLCATDAETIAIDPESVTELRAAWAEAVFLEADLVPLAFTEYDAVMPVDFHGQDREISSRWDKGFRQLEQRGKSLDWSTRNLGEAEENPMAWLLMVMAIRHRASYKLQRVNKVVKRKGDGR
jgi:hypothetical protein